VYSKKCEVLHFQSIKTCVFTFWGPSLATEQHVPLYFIMKGETCGTEQVVGSLEIMNREFQYGCFLEEQ